MLVPRVLVAHDSTHLRREIIPSVKFVIGIIWVSVSRAPPVVLFVDMWVIMRGNTRIDPHRVSPLVEVVTGIRLLPLELVLVRLQGKPN